MNTSSRIWLGVLGPLHVSVDDMVVRLTAGRQRAVLGTLLVRANKVVSFDELTELVWDGSPPRTARVTVRNYVRVLRRLLGPGIADRIVTQDPGYLFAVDETELDLLAFASLCREGQLAIRAGAWQRATDLLGRALELWRGPALVDVSPELLHREEVPRLDRLRLQAIEGRIESEMRLGRHGPLVDELRLLVERHPLHERLHGQLMLALTRAGRRAEALDAYRQARSIIVRELGVEPGGDLQDLHQRILRADPDLDCRPFTDPAEYTTTGRAGPAVVPHQLPAPVQHFIGRGEQVGLLAGLVERDHTGESRTLAIAAVDGMAGVGKTALAVHVAHRLAGRFPDGQLFIDLHGFTEGVAPVDPGVALEAMLRALGVAGEQIPLDVEERAALYRTRLAERRVLVVLDNAATEAQVRSLLPGEPGCLVLVTSRRQLAGLDGVEPLSLDVLSFPEAVALFTRTVGPDRVAAEPAVAGEIVELCGLLPLAIRIAAARLRHRPGWSLTQLAELFRDEAGVLGALRAGGRSVAASVQMSYAGLCDDQRRMFRLLGLHPGADTDLGAAAALADISTRQAGQLLEHLCDANLLDQPVPRRYRQHDLIRAHARDLASTDESEPDRHAALTRLFDHYVHTAWVAVDTLYPYETSDRGQDLAPTAPAPAMDGRTGAATWLDSELPNLLLVAARAAKDWPAHTVALSVSLRSHLDTRARYSDADALHHIALTAAGNTGDRRGELSALVGLGNTRYRQGRLDDATDCLEQALRLSQDLGDLHGEFLARVGLGAVRKIRSQHQEAADCYEKALGIARRGGDRNGEVRALIGLSHAHRMRGAYEQATETLSQAQRAAAACGYRNGETDALTGLGLIYHVRGRLEQATASYQEALRIACDIGARTGELNALLGLGHVHRALGRCDKATVCFERALHIAGPIGDHFSELSALLGLGRANDLPGRHDQAVACYEQALRIASDLGLPYNELFALVGLAAIHHRRGQHEHAIHDYGQALSIARRIGDPNGEFEAMYGLGRTHFAAGRPEQALDHLHPALNLACDLNQPGDQARAHDGLAHAHHAIGRPDQARQHWQYALDILTDLGTDWMDDIRTEDIRARLAGIIG